MPSARASDFQQVARKLGFVPVRQRGSHQHWEHPEGRVATIPVHPSKEISGSLFFQLLKGLGIDIETFNELK
ncbi:MAG: type II toxin-antitoxin system HicA family toxin [Armatimonadetes bacterium]|nr:type II toxin-antitoxin system HicA family toxin [Armatimonadota bacterium]